jgi:SulP family sulfate permease
MQRNRHLMVGLTRTDADAGLIRYAAMVARMGTADRVDFVHVTPTPAGPAPSSDHEGILDEVQGAVRADFGGVPEATRVHCEVLSGPLLDRLLSFAMAKKVDLLLVGHQRSHPGKWLLARRLAMKAPCSLWMVPEGSPPSITRILSPIDFSEHAADALRVATSIARACGHAECIALHDYFNAATIGYEGYAQVIRNEEDRAYRQFMASVDQGGVEVTPLFEEGANIAQLIVRVAREQGVDLIVMSTRGRSRSASILLGSVTEETIIATDIPLLVVKHYGAQMGVIEALLDRDFLRKGNLWFD